MHGYDDHCCILLAHLTIQMPSEQRKAVQFLIPQQFKFLSEHRVTMMIMYREKTMQNSYSYRKSMHKSEDFNVLSRYIHHRVTQLSDPKMVKRT